MSDVLARDKVKIAKLQEAERVEKQSAQEKYQPYKDLTPIEDIINLIRLQKNVRLQMYVSHIYTRALLKILDTVQIYTNSYFATISSPSMPMFSR